MGKHFRKKGSKSSRILKLALVVIIAAAALYAAVSHDYGAKTPESAAVTPQTETRKKEEPQSQDQGGEAKIPSAPVSADEKRPRGDLPLLAVIVDDGGGQMEYAKRVAALELPLTWAILPYQRYSKETAALADSKFIPCLLHMPMQAEVDKEPSKYIIGKGMSAAEITKKISDALNSLPGAIGLNNHRGSLATADEKLMEPVMAELKRRGLIFVDSRTSVKSVAYRKAKEAGLQALQNGGFLDNTADKNAIAARFKEIVKNAEKRGALVVICHFRPSTVSFLEELNGKYKSLPVQMVTVPEMLSLLSGGAEIEK